jgi:hypothetical protein
VPFVTKYLAVVYFSFRFDSFGLVHMQRTGNTTWRTNTKLQRKMSPHNGIIMCSRYLLKAGKPSKTSNPQGGKTLLTRENKQ